MNGKINSLILITNLKHFSYALDLYYYRLITRVLVVVNSHCKLSNYNYSVGRIVGIHESAVPLGETASFNL